MPAGIRELNVVGMPVTTKSPFHYQAYVAASSALGLLGGVVGGAGPASVPGALYGAAVGFVLGEVICSWGPLDRAFRNSLDFEARMRDLLGHALDQLASVPVVQSRNDAAVILRLTLNAVQRSPELYWGSVNTVGAGSATGAATHGIASLANGAAQILRARRA